MTSPASCPPSSKAIPHAAEQLLPLVYDELRKLAAQRLAHEKPGQTLQAHGARPRGLPAAGRRRSRPSTGTAAATSSPRPPRPCGASSSNEPAAKGESGTAAASGAWTCSTRKPLAPTDDEQVLLLDEALTRLAAARPQAAELVKLRFFAGLTLEEIAPILALSPRTARRLWVFARAWLRRDMERSNEPAS